MADNDDDDRQDDEDDRAQVERNATLVYNIHCLRQVLMSAFRDAINLSYRVHYELTSKQVAQKIKRKELPDLRLYMASLTGAVDRFEKALDEKMQRLVE
jgi:hypothetical protein